MELKLPDSMYERWQASDLGTSKIISCDQSTRKVLLSADGGILKNIQLASEQKEKLYVACHINDASVKEKDSECVFDVVMRNQETGMIVGGFRITIPPIAEEPFAQAREIDVKEFNSISRITTTASDFMVSLSSPADNHTAIRISTLQDKSQTIEIQVPSDQKEVTAKLPGNKAGMFVVSLLQEGRVVESRKISIN